jgi:hypothetical protein
MLRWVIIEQVSEVKITDMKILEKISAGIVLTGGWRLIKIHIQAIGRMH